MVRTVALNGAAAVAAVLIGLALVGVVAGIDGYLGRGAVWGAETGTIRPTARALGANTFLHFEVERAKVDRTARMLREAGIGVARQQFAWNEIEPRPGVFVDERGQSTWAKYDYLVDALAREGVQVLARVENTPAWARPGEDTTTHPFGPPADYDRYAAFVAQVVRRYPGKVTAVQVWNEPNLASEWGGRAPDPAAYTDLLRRTHAAVRAADPRVTVVAAGLAPTDGLHPGAMNDLLFLDAMYAAGAKGAFDAMGVMVYGLGQSPDNRHVGLRFPINFSRPVLTREVMVRHGDGATPVWATEYSWISVPADWTGRESTWGRSISETRQAEYLVRGLERARTEWPWMGVMCVWAFRFVEATMDPADPQRHFAIVRDDFSPRPAYAALARQPLRDRATPGSYAVTDPLLRYEGAWETQSLGGRTYRLAGPEARLRLDFHGDRAVIQARLSVDGGRLYVMIDGRPAPGLPTTAGRSYVMLRSGRTIDSDLLLAAGLPPGPHTLELAAGDDGEVAIAGLTISQERPFGWAFLWLHAAGLLALTLAIRALLRLALVTAGYLPIFRAAGRSGARDRR
jgi:hypothetical protein